MLNENVKRFSPMAGITLTVLRLAVAWRTFSGISSPLKTTTTSEENETKNKFHRHRGGDTHASTIRSESPQCLCRMSSCRYWGSGVGMSRESTTWRKACRKTNPTRGSELGGKTFYISYYYLFTGKFPIIIIINRKMCYIINN